MKVPTRVYLISPISSPTKFSCSSGNFPHRRNGCWPDISRHMTGVYFVCFRTTSALPSPSTSALSHNVCPLPQLLPSPTTSALSHNFCPLPQLLPSPTTSALSHNFCPLPQLLPSPTTSALSHNFCYLSRIYLSPSISSPKCENYLFIFLCVLEQLLRPPSPITLSLHIFPEVWKWLVCICLLF